MSFIRLSLLLLALALLGSCATIKAGPTSPEPGWFLADGWGSDDILYCYPPHYKHERYAGKCFSIH